MLTREDIVQATRAFIRSELLRDGNAPLDEKEGLLSGGIITSFDLVSLTVFLEERFAVKVPDAKVSREHLDTLEQITALVLGLRGEAPPEEAPVATGRDPLARLVPSFRRAPALVLAAIAAVAFAGDRVAGALLAREDVVARLEGSLDRKRLSYAYPSYARALERHELALTPKGKDELRVVFQGDSGTYGSFLEADEACPAVAGRVLAAKDPGVRVYNVSYFGQTFVKDAEMLEADLAYAPDLVIVSLSSTYLERTRTIEWWLKPATTMVYNRPLFTRFLEHVPSKPELVEFDGALAETEARNFTGLRRRFDGVSAIGANQLVLRGALLSRLPNISRLCGKPPRRTSIPGRPVFFGERGPKTTPLPSRSTSARSRFSRP